MSVFQNGILRLAWLASLVLALGVKRNGTGLVLLQPEPKVVDSVQQMDAFQFDVMPIIPEEVLSLDELAKTYHNQGTMLKIKTPVMPTTQRKIPTMGAAASRRRLTTQAIATATTKRKVQRDSWRRGETVQQIHALGRKEATRYNFDPASSIMQAVGTRRMVGKQQTLSKGYVRPTARHVGPSRRDQTKRQIKPAQSMRVATTRKTGGVPAQPPPPPSYARKSTRPLQKSVAARPAVLQQTQSPRRILRTSTRRVVVPMKKVTPVRAARRPEQSKYVTKMPTRREVLRIAEETEEESWIEEIVPAKTRRGAVKQPAVHAKPQKSKKKPVKAPSLSSTEYTSTSDLSEAEDSSSSEPQIQGRRHGKKPVATRRKLVAKKPAATRRKVVKENVTRRKQTKAKPAGQKAKKKVVAAVESDSDESTSSDSFERQFTRRQVLKAKPKKPAVKETKRKIRKVVESSSSSSIEEETSSSQVSSSSTSEPSSSTEFVQTRRKGRPGQTKRKVQAQTARKVKKLAAKPPKHYKGAQRKGRKQKKEKPISESVESSVPQPNRKQPKTRRRLVARWKKEEPTTRKVKATKRKAAAGTKRDVKVKEKAKPRGKYLSSEMKTAESSTLESSSLSFRPKTRRQAVPVQTKKKLGYGTPTKRRY